MKYIIISILTVLTLLTFMKKESNTVTLTNSDSILAFGDSLTYGFGANENESYPFRLSLLTKINVINEGVNGDTSKDGLARISPLLENENIKLMILCFGGNDILQKMSMSQLKQNLKTMIQLAKRKNIEVLLISVPNITLFGLSPLDLYEEVAKEENILLLEGLLSDILSQPSLKIDQIHPNAKGYKKMSSEIYESLKKNGFIEN